MMDRDTSSTLFDPFVSASMYNQQFPRRDVSENERLFNIGDTPANIPTINITTDPLNIDQLFELPNLTPTVQKDQNYDNDVEMLGDDLAMVDTSNTLVSPTTQHQTFSQNQQLQQQQQQEQEHPQQQEQQQQFDSFRSSIDTQFDRILNTDIFDEVDIDFRFSQASNMSSFYGDNATLGSGSRTSNELFDGAFIDEDDSFFTKSKFTSSISNSISSIFRNNQYKEKFNFRGINPLSTHKNPESLVQTLPNLTEDLEALPIDQEGKEPKKCIKNLHMKNCDCIKKKRSTTNSIVNALANARLGFNSAKLQQEQSSPEESTSKLNQIKEELDDSISIKNDAESTADRDSNLKLKEDENEVSMIMDFDEELTQVISLASKNSSSYNFNNLMKEENEPEETIPEKHSPDYAALFSDMNAKKRSKSLSFKKMSSASPQLKMTPVAQIPSTPASLDDMSTVDEQQDSITNSNDHLPVEILPLKESTRGRKPSMEYDSTKTFVCTYCSRRFRRQEHLKRHFRSLHTNEKPFDCNLCGKKFSRSDNLTQHIKTHASE